MSMMLGDCSQGWWPEKVAVPVRAHITDTRVVRLHNYSRLAIYLIMPFGFLFYFDWTLPAQVFFEYNAWMDPPPNRSQSSWLNSTEHTATMCNNRDYDYIYDQYWKYENLDCRRLSAK